MEEPTVTVTLPVTPEQQKFLDDFVQKTKGKVRYSEFKAAIDSLYDFLVANPHMRIESQFLAFQQRLSCLLIKIVKKDNLELMQRLAKSFDRSILLADDGVDLRHCAIRDYAIKNREKGLEFVRLLVDDFGFPVVNDFLATAASLGQVSIVQFLLERGADVSQKYCPGYMQSDVPILDCPCGPEAFALLREARLIQFDPFKTRSPANYSGFECRTMKAIILRDKDTLKENLIVALQLSRHGLPFPIRPEILQEAIPVLNDFWFLGFLSQPDEKSKLCILSFFHELKLTGKVLNLVNNSRGKYNVAAAAPLMLYQDSVHDNNVPLQPVESERRNSLTN